MQDHGEIRREGWLKSIMCGSRKYPHPPHGRSLEILRGREASTVKIYKGKYEAKLEIPGGREGSNEKTFHGGGMDIFWNHTISKMHPSKFS